MDNKTPTMLDCVSTSPTSMLNRYSTPKKQVIKQVMPSAPKKMNTDGHMFTNNSILKRRKLKQLQKLVL
jgi:hypothetical protein